MNVKELMTPEEIAKKYVFGNHDSLTDNQEIKDMAADIRAYAEEYAQSKEVTEECYVLLEWINGEPCIDGATFSFNKEDLLRFYEEMPKINNVEYTMCTLKRLKERGK